MNCFFKKQQRIIKEEERGKVEIKEKVKYLTFE